MQRVWPHISLLAELLGTEKGSGANWANLMSSIFLSQKLSLGLSHFLRLAEPNVRFRYHDERTCKPIFVLV